MSYRGIKKQIMFHPRRGSDFNVVSLAKLPPDNSLSQKRNRESRSKIRSKYYQKRLV
ncbi:uncharacterized protein PHALS_00527 [Plasmopara halstedii]|uniref:Uncharacterized protein n=1 Tax=Plasmopara halstedii TaxID=4781 RepID=A0A0P1A730_PLAHL|nr:uncharacterized protein PHALS_00527 [Plasmopara halstedii]CEG36206.1 hypothetical protein PHALS_00527 [Plasmopara halstedii]|eukprot:XP_024572575.1 hypothetical protein PHALS_00527 [Plasmopara halstedii]